MALEISAFVKLAAAVRAASGLSLPRSRARLHRGPAAAGRAPARARPTRRPWSSACRRDSDPSLIQAVVEALAVTETSFFRDKTPFDQLSARCCRPWPRPAATGRVRVWSAACATGQEPYSLALLVEQLRGEGCAGPRWRSSAPTCPSGAWRRRPAGLYTQFEVQRGLPIRLLVDCSSRSTRCGASRPRLRQMVRWRRINLLARPTRREVCSTSSSAATCFPDFDERPAARAGPAGRRPARGRPAGAGLRRDGLGLTDAFRPVPGRRGLYARNPEAARRVA